MVEALLEFQDAAGDFQPIVLIAVGIVCLGVGFCLWLSGLRWDKGAVAVIGGLAGAACACYFTERQLAAFIATALIGAGLGLFFKKPVLILSGALITALILLIIFSAVDKNSSDSGLTDRQSADRQGEVITVQGSLDGLGSELLFLGRKIGEGIGDVPAAGFLIAVSAGVVIVLCGFFLWRPVAAATLSTFGTGLIAAGMVFLLLYKNSAPISHISRKPIFYGAVAGAMIVFGTVAGLLLCPEKSKKTDKDNDGEEK